MAWRMAVIKFNERTHRLIASIYPPVGIFDDFGDADDARAAMELESLTNDRLTGALGKLDAIPKEDQVAGQSGANMAMAAFLHTSPGGGRFHRETLGAWYAALAIETAIQETLYHHNRRLRASEGGFPCSIQMRELLSTPSASLEDLATNRDHHTELYNENDYSASQIFGDKMRAANSDGIIYRSVRHADGTNIVIFRPRLLVPVIQGDHYEYVWDKDGAHKVRKLTNVET